MKLLSIFFILIFHVASTLSLNRTFEHLELDYNVINENDKYFLQFDPLIIKLPSNYDIHMLGGLLIRFSNKSGDTIRTFFMSLINTSNLGNMRLCKNYTIDENNIWIEKELQYRTNSVRKRRDVVFIPDGLNHFKFTYTFSDLKFPFDLVYTNSQKDMGFYFDDYITLSFEAIIDKDVDEISKCSSTYPMDIFYDRVNNPRVNLTGFITLDTIETPPITRPPTNSPPSTSPPSTIPPTTKPPTIRQNTTTNNSNNATTIIILMSVFGVFIFIFLYRYFFRNKINHIYYNL